MKILYIGDDSPSSTSYHRATAMMRLGNEVVLLNPYIKYNLPIIGSLLPKVYFKIGYGFTQRRSRSHLIKFLASNTNIDLVWVNGGEFIGKKNLILIKELLKCPIVLYNNDDPTGGRDGKRFTQLLQALPHYDLCAVMREINVNEFRSLGAKNVIRVTMSYDEVAHKPYEFVEDLPNDYISDIAFIGTWMRNEQRDAFLLDLINKNLNVSIWGDRWHKSPYFEQLKPYYRGGALKGRSYVAAIQGAKICIGMLSKGNRDMHTQRSLEIPFIGGLLCAERTVEHSEFYKEGVDAVFWDNSTECAQISLELLKDDSRRERIRLSGMERVRSNHVGNEDICNFIIRNLLNTKINR